MASSSARRLKRAFQLSRAANRAAAGAGGSPAAPPVTPAPPSVEAINAFSIPPLDISQDETGAAGLGLLLQTLFYCSLSGLVLRHPWVSALRQTEQALQQERARYNWGSTAQPFSVLSGCFVCFALAVLLRSQAGPNRAAQHRGVQRVAKHGVLQGQAVEGSAQFSTRSGSFAFLVGLLLRLLLLIFELLRLIFEPFAYPCEVPFECNHS